MDHIYPTKDYKEYQIKDSVKELQKSVSKDMPHSFDDIARILNITKETLKKKSLELCKIYEDYGSERSSRAEEPFDVLSEEALELNCVKFIRKGGLEFKEKRYKDRCCEKVSTISSLSEDQTKIIGPFEDSIITIRFYEPFKYTPTTKNHPKFHQEYQVLGSNFLSELRDKFYCQCNFGPFFDISENPIESNNLKPTHPNPGFFYIHDTFYNDTRNEMNPDYSSVIIDWFKKIHYVRQFKRGTMQNTKFEDLRVRLGYPCVYQHHGACEHIFCIISIDLIDNADSLNRSDYPRLSYLSKRRAILCDICGQKDANFTVTDCPLHVKDPCRMCDNCFFSLHYIDKKTKTCEFKAYCIHSINPDSIVP